MQLLSGAATGLGRAARPKHPRSGGANGGALSEGKTKGSAPLFSDEADEQIERAEELCRADC